MSKSRLVLPIKFQNKEEEERYKQILLIALKNNPVSKIDRKELNMKMNCLLKDYLSSQELEEVT